MKTNIEETIALNPILSDNQINDQIDQYFNLENQIQTIHRIGHSPDVELHVINRFQYNQAIQFLIPNNQLKTFENISSQFTFNDPSNIEDIQRFFLDNFNLENSEENISNNDYIEWSLNKEYLIEKAKEFHLQIDLYKTYDNQHHLITKLLIEIIEYYINQYLFEEEHFSAEDTLNIQNYFLQAIENQNYLKYFIKAYTLTNNFHHVLNKHLALYLLEYFNTSSYSLFKTKYRLINCLAHIVTLLIHHPDIHQYQFHGITYRGLLMQPNHLKSYAIGNHILNKSFVSTSKRRAVAQLFADHRQMNDQDAIEIPVLLKYTIKQNQTAIDIEDLSIIPDEEEVLILPFSVFKITNRIENSYSDTSSTMFVEIHLEECQQQIEQQLFISNLNTNQTWKQYANTTAGGHGKGNQLSQLDLPTGVFIDADQTIYVADWGNHRIMAWKKNAINGQIVAGGNGPGNRNDQLYSPTKVIIDQENVSLIICDQYNRRVVRWSRRNGEILISNIYCQDLMMDNAGYLYVSDTEKQEVRRWKMGETNGTIVAGGNGKGNQSNQLNTPYYIFIDEDHSVYVSDCQNHRVMKWMKGAKEGIVVAGGQGQGNGLKQLEYPHGITVDPLGSVYVADIQNDRVMCWLKGAEEGTIIVGGNGRGQQPNQFNSPIDLSFDLENNLYVVDFWNHRVQRFDVN